MSYNSWIPRTWISSIHCDTLNIAPFFNEYHAIMHDTYHELSIIFLKLAEYMAIFRLLQYLLSRYPS